MTYEELLGWFSYFEKRPVGWRDDDRTMKYLQTQGVKEKPWAVFSSLKPIYNEGKNSKKDDNPTSSLEGSSLFQKLLLSKNGDDVEWLK